MKRLLSSAFALGLSLAAMAQGWPANYGGVMLQGFSWDSFEDSQWTVLEKKADDFAGCFDLVWVPQSARASNATSMGYDPLYYFNQNSSFGTESELRSMIQTFKAKGIGTIADVVINHHGTNNGWFGFPAETYKGVTYQHQASDVVRNDDGGKAATEAARLGVQLSPNADEGEGWDGMRDLDHNSPNVQKIIKAYEKFLLEDLGYTGFRYDMVKGFYASHIADYNKAANVSFSVGENWSSNGDIMNWINYTEKTSAAFDFQFRYNVRDAINNNNWGLLKSDNNLNHDPAYRQYAVTFVENHDMQDRGTTNNYTPDPIRKDTLAANAYLLAMPGTPCVFLPHYKAYEKEIRNMILVRKMVGVTNMSNYTWFRTGTANAAVRVSGTKGDLMACMGNTANYVPSSSTYTKVISGYHYAYYVSNSLNTAWVDLPGGTYDGAQTVTLTAISGNSNAKLVYTTDGSTPTATNGTVVSSGAKVNLAAGGATVLKVGLLVDGVVKGIASRTYNIVDFQKYDIKIYVNADEAGSAWASASTAAAHPSINFWFWGGNHATAKGSWPGDAVTTVETVKGKKWFVKTFTIENSSDNVSFVFSVGTGTPQTVNLNKVTETTFVTISSQKDGANYKLNAVTTGIENIQAEASEPALRDNHYYTLSGQRLTEKPTQRGIYIHQGRKIIIK
ncbi:MAG: chitobiase/beta-hexosaminidase C-terminal domain-containing protein [Prevotella sp.]|nr:chitobiase/beta-hexosaminidase C-terminal domain-containing protein [Prevotella sp.]